MLARSCTTRNAVGQDACENIEPFYDPKRKRTNNGMLSPVDCEIWLWKLNEAGVWETGCASPTAIVDNLDPSASNAISYDMPRVSGQTAPHLTASRLWLERKVRPRL